MGTVARIKAPDQERRRAWRRAKRILAVRLDSLGDVVMISPALRALRQAVPGRSVSLLASGSGVAAGARLPEVDQVIELPGPWMPGETLSPGQFEDALALLRSGGFDAAVIFTSYSQSPLPAALLCWQAGIGLRLAHCRENPYHLLTDWIPDPEPHELLRHEVRRQLDLVACVGCRVEDERLSFRVDAADMRSVLLRLEAVGIDPRRPWIVVHPGASAESRRYPAERFGEALAQLVAARVAARPRDDLQIVITGSRDERALCLTVLNTLHAHGSQPAALLAGELSLGELAALLAPAALLIANNTGPVHVAAALGTPVVDIYALTNPQHAPWRVPHRVLIQDVPCRFCYRSVCPQSHHHCLHLLDPARVAEAARQLLELGADRAEPPQPASQSTTFASSLPDAAPSRG